MHHDFSPARTNIENLLRLESFKIFYLEHGRGVMQSIEDRLLQDRRGLSDESIRALSVDKDVPLLTRTFHRAANHMCRTTYFVTRETQPLNLPASVLASADAFIDVLRHTLNERADRLYGDSNWDDVNEHAFGVRIVQGRSHTYNMDMTLCPSYVGRPESSIPDDGRSIWNRHALGMHLGRVALSDFDITDILYTWRNLVSVERMLSHDFDNSVAHEKDFLDLHDALSPYVTDYLTDLIKVDRDTIMNVHQESTPPTFFCVKEHGWGSVSQCVHKDRPFSILPWFEQSPGPILLSSRSGLTLIEKNDLRDAYQEQARSLPNHSMTP